MSLRGGCSAQAFLFQIVGWPPRTGQKVKKCVNQLKFIYIGVFSSLASAHRKRFDGGTFTDASLILRHPCVSLCMGDVWLWDEKVYIYYPLLSFYFQGLGT